MRAIPSALYQAWTRYMDRWFAEPGSVLMKEEVNAVFFWQTYHAGERHPHYGRFLRLEPDRLVELTWLTGMAGTKGAETVVTVELAPEGTGAHLLFTHAGFLDQASRDQYEQAWLGILTHLDERMVHLKI
ncbi:MAG TPA: SRPBCC domain-containing protein [Ktedonobacteraceae bacterium]|nr:SRPBCC domain-containing protein [Ktedonobacteraceae bacterium]